MDMGSEFHLNQEILFEILSRATLETLDTFKVVSKESKELVEESWFIRNYAEKTKNFIGYIVEKLEPHRCSYTFVSINPSLGVPGISMECFCGMTILASSEQGILCCRKYEDRSHHYYVCKPSTRQCVELPTPRGRAIFPNWFGLTVLKSNPLQYKIIRLSRQSGKTGFICQIFDSKFWTWRQSENIIMEGCSVFSFQPSVCIGGILYLLTDRKTVWAFDSATETHSEFLGPITTTEDNRSCCCEAIVEYNGKLGFTSVYKWEELRLWVLEDYRWEIKKVVEIDKKNRRLIGCSLADMALMIGYGHQVSGSYSHQTIFPFRSDWEPVDLEDGCMLGGLEEMFTS
ncbi:PREDICTED: F-box protein At5g49610-like [Ipomoea nil]|uniref:F-box protein At5g49610-like n=1 Tax=Ipomoea nil TaxID=35883 RepID=UPI000900E261|nr:PREDICTED: F-box protein At5g49610-like [Ipomoea nil]